jgi:hypothetical protein
MPDKIDLDRLLIAMARSRLVLRRYREERSKAVKQFVGSHYSDDAVRQKVPLNLIRMYCQIVGSKLVAHSPRVMLSTFAKQNKAPVQAMEAWVNHQLPKMKFARTMQRCVLDSFFGLAIMKVALATPAHVSLFGAGTVKVGEPFAERVSFDDFAYDIHCRDLAEAQFAGHRYRVPLSAIRNSTLYNFRQRKNLTASSDPLFNREGDERLNVLGRTTIAGSDSEEYREMVDLWEFWIPDLRKIVTVADPDSDGVLGGEGFDTRKPLREQDWVGPPTGPFHYLPLDDVPDNPMPVGPALALLDLHEATNENLRKLMRQAANFKQVCFVQGGANEDGSRILTADDGDIVKLDNPENIAQTNFRGPNAEITQFMLALKEMFSWASGNLDILGGLSPQSKTASQDQMLNQNSAASVADMQEKVIAFNQEVVSALCWYWWYHPTGTMTITKKLPGLPDAEIQRKVFPRGHTLPNGVPHPMARDAWFEDLDIMVDPYSLQHSTPQEKLAKIMQLVTQVIIPMQPLLQQQGVFFDVNAFLEHVAKYNNLPDLNDIVSIAEPLQTQGQPGQSQAEMGQTKPPSTNRTYTRENVSSRTQQGTSEAMRMGLMGQNPGGNPSSRNGKPSMNGAMS